MKLLRASISLLTLASVCAVFGCEATVSSRPQISRKASAGTSKKAEKTKSNDSADEPESAPSASMKLEAGKKFHYEFSGEGNVGTMLIEVTERKDDSVTYDMTMTMGEKSQVASGKTGQISNGVFDSSSDEMVKNPIASYPKESVTVKAGTFTCHRVESGSNTVWFSGEMFVKMDSAGVVTQLVKVE